MIFRLQQANFGNKELGIIKALLLGQRRDIAPETLSQYRRAGAVHILAISGLHVGILLMILRALFYPLTILPGGRFISLCLSVLILWVYALMAGFSPSVIRAVAMFSFLAYSLFLNRLSHGYNSLALSMFFLLVLIDPNLIFQVGFQMSYAAVLAILWVYPVFLRLWNPRFWILKRVWQLLAVSLSAQMGVLPISLYYFHQFPALFIISSLVIIPFLGLILGGGVVIMALSLLETLPVFIAELYNQLIFHMNGFVGLLARQDAFFFEDLSFDGFELVLGYTLLISLVKWLKKPAGLAARNILIALVLFQGYGTCEGYMARNTERILILHQYGNSVLLHQKGQKLDVYGANAKSKATLIKDFRVGARIEKVAYLTLRKNYAIQGKCITRLDSTATDLPEESNGILWLTYSPRINLDRYINYCDPKMIIADGSNYPNLVRKWKQTATEKNIPFHFTGESGSLLFDL